MLAQPLPLRATKLCEPPEHVISEQLQPPRATNFMKMVGADLYIRPNALCLYEQSIYSLDLR